MEPLELRVGRTESGTLESNQGGTGISDQRAAIAHVPASSEGWDRTSDRLVNSEPLHRLSYLGMCGAP